MFRSLYNSLPMNQQLTHKLLWGQASSSAVAIRNASDEMSTTLQVTPMDIDTCLRKMDEDFDMMDDEELLADDMDDLFEYKSENSVECLPSSLYLPQSYKVSVFTSFDSKTKILISDLSIFSISGFWFSLYSNQYCSRINLICQSNILSVD